MGYFATGSSGITSSAGMLQRPKKKPAPGLLKSLSASQKIAVKIAQRGGPMTAGDRARAIQAGKIIGQNVATLAKQVGIMEKTPVYTPPRRGGTPSSPPRLAPPRPPGHIGLPIQLPEMTDSYADRTRELAEAKQAQLAIVAKMNSETAANVMPIRVTPGPASPYPDATTAETGALVGPLTPDEVESTAESGGATPTPQITKTPVVVQTSGGGLSPLLLIGGAAVAAYFLFFRK